MKQKIKEAVALLAGVAIGIAYIYVLASLLS